MTWKRLLPLLSLFSLLLAGSAFALPRRLTVDVSEPERMDADLRIEWTATITNHDAVSWPISMHLWPSVGSHTLVAMPEGCTAWGTGGNPHCEFELAAQASRVITFTTQAKANVGIFGASAEVFGVSPVPFGSVHALEHETTVFGDPYLVTNAEDRGPGSLRQAVTDLNRDCVARSQPCSVIFALEGAVPESGFFTIRLQSALPEIVGSVVSFDGRSQTRHTGDTNHGPEVLLDGTDVRAGHGLTFRGSSPDVRDLAIGGFPENGIDVVGDGTVTLHRVNLGSDATGLRPLPNGYRGVQVTGGSVSVVGCVLSGNGRAGAWFWTGEDVTVRDSYVGVGADGVTPMGNGASGLFFHNPRLGYRAAAAFDNVIANNGHAGIGLSLLAVGDFGLNVMHDNRNGAIDVALDGPTLETKRGNPGQGGIQGPPMILSATYENGVTTITGRKNVPAGSVRVADRIQLYAASSVGRAGTAEAEELIGVLEDVRSETFTFHVAADLRGRYVSASQYSIYIYDWDSPAPGTSELSLPEQVH